MAHIQHFSNITCKSQRCDACAYEALRDEWSPLALKVTRWLMCERVQGMQQRSQRSEMLLFNTPTRCKSKVKINGPVCLRVCSWHMSCTDTCLIIDHTHTHTHTDPRSSQASSGVSCCFTASPATTEGWQPRSKWGRRENGERREGKMWFFGMDYWGVSVSWKGERRWKTGSETGPEGKEREKGKRLTCQMCSFSLDGHQFSWCRVGDYLC